VREGAVAEMPTFWCALLLHASLVAVRFATPPRFALPSPLRLSPDRALAATPRSLPSIDRVPRLRLPSACSTDTPLVAAAPTAPFLLSTHGIGVLVLDATPAVDGVTRRCALPSPAVRLHSGEGNATAMATVAKGKREPMGKGLSALQSAEAHPTPPLFFPFCYLSSRCVKKVILQKKMEAFLLHTLLASHPPPSKEKKKVAKK